MENVSNKAISWFYNLSSKDQKNMTLNHLGSRSKISIEGITLIYKREILGEPYTPIERKEHEFPVNLIGLNHVEEKITAGQPLNEKELINVRNFIHMMRISKKFATMVFKMYSEVNADPNGKPESKPYNGVKSGYPGPKTAMPIEPAPVVTEVDYEESNELPAPPAEIIYLEDDLADVVLDEVEIPTNTKKTGKKAGRRK